MLASGTTNAPQGGLSVCLPLAQGRGLGQRPMSMGQGQLVPLRGLGQRPAVGNKVVIKWFQSGNMQKWHNAREKAGE
jgi:hypothetical protein